jgi:hypothetical protein
MVVSMGTNYTDENPQWKKLCQQHDDLQWILLNYGKRLTKKLLKETQAEFKRVERKLAYLDRKLEKLGYFERRI